MYHQSNVLGVSFLSLSKQKLLPRTLRNCNIKWGVD